MKFTEIYNSTISVWPNTIDLLDAKLKNDGSGIIPSLVSAWESAEIATDEWSEWHQLMVWAIYSGLHKLGAQYIAEGKNKITISNIDLSLIERIFHDNLFTKTEPAYPADMKNNYVNDVKS